MAGVRSTDLPTGYAIDSVIANRNGDTVAVPMDWLAVAVSGFIGPAFELRSQLYADLSWPEGAVGQVWGDPTSGYIGTYRKSGAVGSGSWSRIGNLPASSVGQDAIAGLQAQVALAEAASGRTVTVINTGVGNAAERNIRNYTYPVTLHFNPANEGVLITGGPSAAINDVWVWSRREADLIVQRYMTPSGNVWRSTYDGANWSSWTVEREVKTIVAGSSNNDRSANLYRTPGQVVSITDALIYSAPPYAGARTIASVVITVSSAADGRVMQDWLFPEGARYTRIRKADDSIWLDFERVGNTDFEWDEIDASAEDQGVRFFGSGRLSALRTVYTADGSTTIWGGPTGDIAYSGTWIVTEDYPGGPQLLTFWPTGEENDPWERRKIGTVWSSWQRHRGAGGRLAGQHVVGFGDSIMWGTGASSRATENMLAQAAMTLGFSYTNWGIGGGNMSPTNSSQSGNNVSQLTATKTSDIQAAEIVLVHAGANDYSTDVPIGTLADTTDVTLLGAMEVAYSNIVTANPAARVVFMAMKQNFNLSATNGLGLSMIDYHDAILSFCAKYSLQCIDLWALSGFNAKTYPQLSDAQHIHPNTAGYWILGQILVRDL